MRVKLPTHELIPTRVKLTPSLVERLEKMCVAYHVTYTQVFRDGLDMKLTELERKIEEREEKKKQKKLDEKSALLGHHLLGARPVGGLPVLGRPVTQPITTPFAERVPFGQRQQQQAEEDRFVTSLAQNILDAGSDQDEMRRRAIAAVAAYKREHPLLAPSDSDILTLLERHIIMLRERGVTPARTVDSLVGSIMDVSKIRSGGAKLDDE